MYSYLKGFLFVAALGFTSLFSPFLFSALETHPNTSATIELARRGGGGHYGGGYYYGGRGGRGWGNRYYDRGWGNRYYDRGWGYSPYYQSPYYYDSYPYNNYYYGPGGGVYFQFRT